MLVYQITISQPLQLIQQTTIKVHSIITIIQLPKLNYNCMISTPTPKPKTILHLDGIQQILRDKSVCASYLTLVSDFSHLFADKQVLILYSGLGFLALAVSKTQAKHMHVICSTQQEWEITEILVKENGFQDRVTVYMGPIESSYFDVKVDIIVSMPFGYCLYFDNRVETLLFARDNFLKTDGLMFPDKLVLRCSMLQDSYYHDKKVLFWENVYNIDMSPMIKWVMTEPIIDIVDPAVISTDIETLKTIDLNTVQPEELDFVADYQLRVREHEGCNLHAMVIWFDAHFSQEGKSQVGNNQAKSNHIVLSTSPFSSKTKYKQSIFYLEREIAVTHGDIVKGKIAVQRGDNRTNFKIGFESGEHRHAQYYFLS